MNGSPDRSIVIASAALLVAMLLFGAALVRAVTVTSTAPAPMAEAVGVQPARTVPTETGTPAARHDSTARAESEPPDSAGAASESGPVPTGAPATRMQPPQSPAERTAAVGVRGATITVAAQRQTVQHDPFQPDRSPPPPYRMPGELVAAAPTEAPARPAPPAFKLLGTVSWEDHGLALLQVEEETPQPLLVGERLRGYRLESVGADHATLVGDGQTLQLAVADPSPQPAQSARDNNRSRARTQFNAAQFGRGGQAIFNRLLQQGASPALIQQMMERLQQRGVVGGRSDRNTSRGRGRGGSNAPQPDGDS